MKLVFIHGSGGTGRVWRFQTEHFAGSAAVTLPGHPEGEPCGSIEEATRWLRSELRSEAGAEPLVLVGHSLGGAIALQYALEHRDEVAGIVLVGSGARLRVHPATLKALEQAIDRPESFETMFAESFRMVAPEFAKELGELTNTLGPAPFLNDLRACDRFDVIDRLGEIDVPVLAIVRIIDGGTHFVFAEFPDEVNRAIADFVAALGAS
jgi:pimeloyl-ACP methyl ester carboxylesterase